MVFIKLKKQDKRKSCEETFEFNKGEEYTLRALNASGDYGRFMSNYFEFLVCAKKFHADYPLSEKLDNLKFARISYHKLSVDELHHSDSAVIVRAMDGIRKDYSELVERIKQGKRE